jgi:cation transport protein ChaC
LIADGAKEEVLAYLDYREKGGYTRELVDVYTKENESGPTIFGALLYRATESNPEYLGHAPLPHIALQIVNSVGPSGKNVEYFLNLAKSMRDMQVEDQHLIYLEKLIIELVEKLSKEDEEPTTQADLLQKDGSQFSMEDHIATG